MTMLLTRRALARAVYAPRPVSVLRPPPLARYATDAGVSLQDAVEGQNRQRGAPGVPQASPLEAKREQRFKQYEEKLHAKAKERGLSGVDELRAKHEAALEQQRAEQRAAVEKARSEDIKSQMDAEQERTSSVEARDEALRERLRRQREQDEAAKLAGGGPQKSAVKPLSSFLDVEKISKESADTIGKLWTGYHALRNKLSAAIPTDTYRQMLDTARSYPQFVLPLPREEAAAEGKEAQRAFEMHYLQWVVLPNEGPQGNPPPSAAMIASLAEYKLRQEYAQPSLVLTHYTDLAESKGIVLMRGDITSRQGGEAEGSPMLSQQDAQMLAMCMQRFYRRDEAEPGSSAAAGNEERTNLLRLFHESPGDFDLSKLLDAAFRV